MFVEKLKMVQDVHGESERVHLERMAVAISDWLNDSDHDAWNAQQILLDVLMTVPMMRSCRRCKTGAWMLPLTQTDDTDRATFVYRCDDCGEVRKESVDHDDLNEVWRAERDALN